MHHRWNTSGLGPEMLSALLARNSNMPKEFQEFLVHRNQTNDWISLLKASHQNRPPSDTGSSWSDTENHFRRNLSRSSSNADAVNWNESSLTSPTTDLTSENFRSSDLPSPDFRSAVKAGKSERYKTELCRSFEETGFCKYKEKCQFAHGLQELRNVQRHPKYKTDRCRTYHSTGFCPYGSRCHFIHAEQTSQTTSRPGPRNTEIVLQPRRESAALNDFRSRVSEPEFQKDHPVAVNPDQLERFLETFNRVLMAVSAGSQSSSSPSPTLPNFESPLRQESVTSGSLCSSPEQLPTPTTIMRDDFRMAYSRIPSCASDYDGYGLALQSPSSPMTPLSASIGTGSLSAFASVWTRAGPHPLSSFSRFD